MIWTHHLKDINYNASFVPEGAPPTETYNGRLLFYYDSSPCGKKNRTDLLAAITLGAGVQWHEAYDAVQARGRVLVGGASAGGSVGSAGGWLLGGA